MNLGEDPGRQVGKEADNARKTYTLTLLNNRRSAAQSKVHAHRFYRLRRKFRG